MGRNINSSFKPLAQQIVKECANLPILIDKVARTFRGKEENILLWQAGLNRLIVYPSVRDQSMDEVLNLLAFCYEGLDDEDKKLCSVVVLVVGGSSTGGDGVGDMNSTGGCG